MAKMQDYSNNRSPNWCPGCGHFSVLRALQVAAARLEIPKEDIVTVSGIGCSGRLSGYMRTHGFHGIHGRSLPIAQGIKLSNSKLTVVATGGDGDGFAIGLSHTLHAIRRNIDITYIVLNNQVYGLTKGHTSPLSEIGYQSKSTPYGASDKPIIPAIMALSNDVSFLAQGFSGFQDELVEIVMEAIQHIGFSMVNVFSPCITYNRINTYQWFRDNLVNLSSDKAYDPQNYKGAMEKLIDTKGLCTGVIYKNNDIPINKSNLSIVDSDLNISLQEFEKIQDQFR